MEKQINSIRFGQVASIDDESEGDRIKVRILEDSDMEDSELPYAFPLMPKLLHIKPKIGELVLVFFMDTNKKETDRYYIGPIISQRQYNNFDSYDYGRGSSTSLMPSGGEGPLGKISMYDSTKGSFPNDEDVSLIGRYSEDVILKDNALNIRCGVRKEPINNDNKDLKGYIIFNDIDPAYIQMRYKQGLIDGSVDNKDDNGTNSVINIVADKINLISHDDNRISNVNLTDKEQMIRDEELKKLISNLHPSTYSDELIKILDLMRAAIMTHTHNYPGNPSLKDKVMLKLENEDFTKIQSKYIRIS